VSAPAAARVARSAAEAGVPRLVHVSGIGADAGSPSAYIRSRGEGEVAVLRAFAAATLIRPAVMFGPDDAFVAPLLSMLRRLPAFPLFGNGGTRLQPVYVEDIGEAVARIMRLPATERIYELAGPQVYDYRSLLLVLGESLGKERLLLPVPFALWKIIGTIGELLPARPITRSQVELMECDNIASPGVPGFANLGLTWAPRQLFSLLAKCCSLACCMRSSCAIGHISAGTPQMMQGNFGKAIEPYGENGGPDPNRGVADHVVVSPQARPQSPGQLCLQREWDRAWQADLAAVGVAAKQQIEIGMRCLTIDLGSMRQQDRKFIIGQP